MKKKKKQSHPGVLNLDQCASKPRGTFLHAVRLLKFTNTMTVTDSSVFYLQDATTAVCNIDLRKILLGVISFFFAIVHSQFIANVCYITSAVHVIVLVILL